MFCGRGRGGEKRTHIGDCFGVDCNLRVGLRFTMRLWDVTNDFTLGNDLHIRHSRV